MLPDRRKEAWRQILAPITDITRDEIDVRSLRENFDNSDKYRYAFYVLNDESDTFWQVKYSDQIIEPLSCVLKVDEENFSAEVFM